MLVAKLGKKIESKRQQVWTNGEIKDLLPEYNVTEMKTTIQRELFGQFFQNIPILERLGLASPNLLHLWLPVGWLVLCEEGDCGSWRRNKKGLTSEICHIGACGKN